MSVDMFNEARFDSVQVTRCANSACPNKPNEGAFALVQTQEPVVGGFRPLQFLLCAPCAEALIKWTTS